MSEAYATPDFLARSAAAVANGISREYDQKLAMPLIESWRRLSASEQEAARERARVAQERRTREAREAHERRVAAAWGRYEAVRSRTEHSTLLALVELHAPSEDDESECSGCPVAHDCCSGDIPADWPCDTFLLIETA